MKYSALILLIAVFSGCKKDSLFSIELKNMKGESITQDRIADGEYLIYYFLSPECPLSENYTKTINDISISLDSVVNRFASYVIIPGDKFDNDEIDSFANEYHILIPVLFDRQNELVQYLGATVTPEVFIINSNAEIIYSGAIDNWAVDLGHKRQVITEHYLKDAIAAINKGDKIKISTTRAVGCFIE